MKNTFRCPRGVVLVASFALGAAPACSSDEKAKAHPAASASDAGADARSPQGDGSDAGVDAGGALEAQARSLVAQMTLDEKLAMMAGTGTSTNGFWPVPGVPRLSVPGLMMSDGARGLGATQWVADSPVKGTCFPVGSARGATFDVDLEERVGEAIGQETRAFGGNVILAPVVNLLRHPAWGRAQETYGEDPMHLGAMGAAFVRGAQRHVIANPKHFVANDIEDTRFTVSIDVDERTLRDVFLAPFKATVDAGALSVMSAYNRVNGTYCSENAHLLTDVLRNDWHFPGFVESDWILAVRSSTPSVLAGLDIEMPSASYFKPDTLKTAIDSGDIALSVIDDAVTRIVRAELEIAARRDPTEPASDVVGGQPHADLALEVARSSMVLLKNDGALLPLDRAKVKHLAVVGSFASIARLGDDGSSKVVPGHAITPVDGLRNRAPAVALDVLDADTVAPADEATITAADAAIVVVGLTAADEHENVALTGGDRKTLALSDAHNALVASVEALNPHTIVVIEAGSAVTMQPWGNSVPGILMAFYPGQEGGNAIADVLFGDVNPSGRLPVTFPVAESDLPTFDRTSVDVTYDYFHGYRYVDHQGTAPAYPFGFGLSYTTFELQNLVLSAATLPPGGTVTASVEVKNTGARDGDDVVELYVGYPGSTVPHGPHELRAFTKVHVAVGASTTVKLPISANELSYYDVSANGPRLEPLKYAIYVGSSSRDLPLQAELSVR